MEGSFNNTYLLDTIEKYRAIFKDSNDPLNKKFTTFYENVVKVSKDLYSKIDGCPIRNYNIVSKIIIQNLNSNNLQQLSTSKSAEACIVKQLVTNPPYKNFVENIPLHLYTKNPKTIGDKSSFGTIFSLTDVNGDTLPFVVKTTKDRSDVTIITEAVIGFYVINNIRKRIPNFLYTYGVTQCSPAFDANGNMISMCDAPGNTPYIFIEYLKNGNTFTNKLTELKWDESNQINSANAVMNWYLQVMLAIKFANDTYDYTHYDLHTSNVFIVDYEPVQYLISTPYGDKYIQCNNGIAKIIDYGMNHVKFTINDEGNQYSLGLLQGKVGILPDRSNPLYDAYKLLMFIAYYLINKVKLNRNHLIIQYIIKLFQYFNNVDDIDRALNFQFKNLYAFTTIDDGIGNASFEGYLEYIYGQTLFKQFIQNTLLENRSQLPMFDFSDVSNGDDSQLLLSIINDKNPITLNGIGDVLFYSSTINNLKNKQKYGVKINKFNQKFSIDNEFNSLNRSLRLINDTYRKIHPTKINLRRYKTYLVIPPNIIQQNASGVNTINTNMNSYRVFINDINRVVHDINKEVIDTAYFINLLQHFRQAVNNFKNYLYTFQKDLYSNTNNQQKINDYITRINDNLNSLRQDNSYIKQVYDILSARYNVIKYSPLLSAAIMLSNLLSLITHVLSIAQS